MKKFNVLVTGVSGIIGYGVVNSLKASKYDCNIIGIDIYDDAVGQYWCDFFEKGVMASSDRFPTFLYDMIVKYNIDLVIPCIEPELEVLMKHKERFDKLDVELVLNNEEVYPHLHNKAKTYDFLNGKIEQIPTLIGRADFDYDYVAAELGVPFILKKNISYASQGVVTINDQKDFDYWKYRYSDGYICQKKIQGDNEYTISVFGTQNGDYVNMIVFWRKLGNGITVKAKCITADDEMIDYVTQLCDLIRPIGPTNIQLIKDGSKYLLLEVNPRVSASTSIRTEFGVNEAEMCIEYFLLNKIPGKRQQKRGSAIRYLKDVIQYDSDHL